MLINRREVRVEWGDCDPGGIVYYPRYFEYCDACTNALFQRAGLPKPFLLEQYNIAGIPLVGSQARFLLPSQFGDTLTVESCIVEWGRGSFSVRHRMLK
jgi:4-hydroxybenzoyl-CoA thioesterase